MNEEAHIIDTIDRIELSEGDSFLADRVAVLHEIEKHKNKQSSLSIKLLSILGGFLASVAFVAFLGIAGLFDSEASLLLFGLGSVIAAIWMDKAYDRLSIDTLSISLYLIGLALITAGLMQMKVDDNIVPLLFITIAIATLWVTKNYILSFLAFLAISGSFLSLIAINEVYNLLHLYSLSIALLLSYLMLNEAKIITGNKKLAALYDSARIGLIISFLFPLTGLGKRNLIPVNVEYNWVTTFVLFMVLSYIIWLILALLKVKKQSTKISVYLLVLIIAITTAYSPAILGAILVILLSFRVNYKTGLALGVTALTYFIAQYYYDLNLTLLTKSIILFLSGLVFTGLYLLVKSRTRDSNGIG